MALPPEITESYLLSCSNDLKTFWQTVRRRALESVQSLVSEFTSEISTAKCIFRDRDGRVLHETPDAPPPVEAPRALPRAPVNAKIEKAVAATRQLGLSNANAVVQLAEAFGQVSDRVTQLERQIAGMQKALDTTRKAALSYSGEWQSALPYQPGALVKHNGAMYAALKDIKAGGNLRDGSGWEKLV